MKGELIFSKRNEQKLRYFIKEEKLKKNFAGFDIEYYLKHAISFSLDKEKLEAMNLFLKYAEDLN